jgi:hypothetical protein
LQVSDADAEMVLGSRDDHRLHLVRLHDLQHRTINMNENGDGWVSFTAMDLYVNPSCLHLNNNLTTLQTPPTRFSCLYLMV